MAGDFNPANRGLQGSIDRTGTMGSGPRDRALDDGANAAEHGPQAIAPGGAQVLEQIEAGEIVLDVEGEHLLRPLAVVGGEHHPQQALDDEGIAVGVEPQPAVAAVAVDPHLALATPHQVGVVLDGGLHGGQLLAQVDDVLVALFPGIEEAQGVEDVLGADGGAEGVGGHGCPVVSPVSDVRPLSKKAPSRAAPLPTSSPGSRAGRTPAAPGPWPRSAPGAPGTPR